MIYFLFLTFRISGSLKVSLYRQDRIVFYISSSFLFRAFSPFIFNVITFGFMTTILLFMFTFSLFLPYVSFFFYFIYSIGEGNGNPLQYSCLENPLDGGAW